jgi:hypothetical protein
MVVMWVVLLVVVVVVGGIAAAAVLRRPRGGDLTSVEKYHSALGTIEDISNRTAPSSVRVVGTTDGPGRTQGDVGRPGLPDPDGPLVFDDADASNVSRLGPQVPRTDRAQRNALESMNRRPRRATAVVVAVVVVVLFGVLAYAGSRRSGPGHHGASTGSTTTRPASTATSAPAGGSGHTDKSHHGHGTSKSSTTTTLPAKLVALSSTGASALYPVANNSYTVTVTASAPCWVLATVASSGSTLWTGTLQAGGSQAIQATGAVKLELGAPSVTLTVDNVPVVLPTPVHTPFVATFQPTAAAPSGAATTTTTTTVPG